MRKLLAAAVMIALLGLGGAAQADYLLNLPANQYGKYSLGQPTYALPIAAGVWDVTLVSPETNSQAQYWAWQPWGGVANWHTVCALYDGTTQWIFGLHNATSTAQEAFWQTANSGNGRLRLILEAPTTLYIGVSDSVIVDNGGGLSLLITPVPEPSSLLAIVGGIGCLVPLLRRRR